MVLIASVTAGVLFNVAGLLESETEQTSEGMDERISEHLSIVAVTGDKIVDRGNGTREIQRVTVVVTTSTAGNPIDLRNLTAQWIGPDGTFNLLHNETADDPGQETFNTTVFRDPDGTFPVLTDEEDRYGLRFQPGTEFGSRGIGEGKSIELSILTKAGTGAEIRISVPPSLTGRDAVEL
jgi:archaellin